MKHLKMPQLETERLILRPVALSDAQDMFDYASDAETVEWVSFAAHTSVEETADTIRNVFLTRQEKGNPAAFALVLKANGTMIGTCDFFKGYGDDVFELGYILNKAYWRQGLMFEAAQAVIQYAFQDFGVRRLMIRHYQENKKSQGMIEKLGFHYEGTLRKFALNKHQTYSNMLIYSILQEEYHD